MLPLHIAVSKGTSTEVIALLASRDMPVSQTGETVVTHSHSWSFLVDQNSDECSHAVTLLLNARATDAPSGYGYGRHAAALAEVIDQNSQKALQIAESGPRQAIYKHLASNCGFEVSTCGAACSLGRLHAVLADSKHPPVNKSHTSFCTHLRNQPTPTLSLPRRPMPSHSCGPHAPFPSFFFY